jgi:hypothetical protein
MMYDILRPEITWFFPLHLGSSEELLREFGGTILREFGGTILVAWRNYLGSSVSWSNYLWRDSDLRQEGDLLREVLDRSFTVPTVVQYCDFIPVMSTTHVIFECSSRSPTVLYHNDRCNYLSHVGRSPEVLLKESGGTLEELLREFGGTTSLFSCDIIDLSPNAFYR